MTRAGVSHPAGRHLPRFRRSLLGRPAGERAAPYSCRPARLPARRADSAGHFPRDAWTGAARHRARLGRPRWRLSRVRRSHRAALVGEPLRTALLGVSKTLDFWLPDFFIASNIRSGALGPVKAWLWRPVLFVTIYTYLILVSCAVAGILRTDRIWETRFVLLIIVLYTLPHALVYGSSRYHLPLMPLFILLTASIIGRAWLRLASKCLYLTREPL